MSRIKSSTAHLVSASIASVFLLSSACTTGQADADDANHVTSAAVPAEVIESSITKPDGLEERPGAPAPIAAPEFIPDTPAPFVVHEWGTFTSVQGPDGRTYGRMYEEDEPLPGFVHRFQPSASSRPTKGFDPVSAFDVLAGVTQRLETPVLYFYGEPREGVRVSVGFPEGIVSEWYPDASAYYPRQDDFRRVSGGSMTWTFDLLDRAARVIPVPADDVWAPSRDVDALTVKVGEEEEPFIFYRGVGSFELPVKVKSERTGQLTIENASSDALEHVFVYKRDERGAKLFSLGEIKAGQALEHGGSIASPSPKEGPRYQSVEKIKARIAQSLTASGLYEPEARAMLDTWERSYFETPGIRVLYVVPRQWTDELLPIQIDPAPDKLERVLIGRIEVTSRDQLDGLSSTLREHYRAGTTPDMETLDAFLQPRMFGLAGELQDREFSRWLGQQILARHKMMPVLKPVQAQGGSHEAP